MNRVNAGVVVAVLVTVVVVVVWLAGYLMSLQHAFVSQDRVRSDSHLIGLVVMVPASRAEDLWFESCL